MARWGRPPLRTLGIAGLGGGIAALGQAPLGFWFLTLPALAFLFHRITAQPDARAAAWAAWAAGTGYFLAAMSWIVEPFLIDIGRHGWMAPFALFLMGGGLALFWGLAGWAAHRAGRAGADRAALLAVALTAAEMARGYVFTGLPWAMIGHVWIGTAWDQLAAYAGAGGLTLLTCLIAALPVIYPRTGVLPALTLLAGGFFLGQQRLALPDPPPREVTLRLVQPNAAQHLKWDPDQAAIIFRRLLELSSEGARPDLVIWPETSVPYLFDDGVAAAIASGTGRVPVAVGAQIAEGEAAYNSLVVLDPAGGIIARYDKAHLVPFGEYVPLGDLAWAWFGLRAFAAQEGYGYAAGPGPAVLDLGPGLGRILPLICYEAVFPQSLRTSPERADWILQVTNDAWFGTLTGPFQHLAQARLRAIEQGLPLIRVANTGVTAVIDARGRIVDQLPFGEAGALDAQLPGALEAPPYARWGEWPLLLLLSALFISVIAIHRRKPA